ncbi:hypothetical protein LJK88_05125 [Paenibacillus sp. P26]|nr:hypothetical protein LJK88_05125 [Paenibacillus sp. P26]
MEKKPMGPPERKGMVGMDGHLDLDAVQPGELMMLLNPNGDPVFGSSYDEDTRSFWTQWLSGNKNRLTNSKKNWALAERDGGNLLAQGVSLGGQ